MKNIPWLGFSIERGSSVPVFEQICQAIRAAIAGNAVPDGQRLPPTRAFATELGVSRSTVVSAYEQLVAEGYLTSVPGSGYKANPTGSAGLPPPKPASLIKTRPTSQIAEHPRPFSAGTPDMRLFPHRQWSKTVARICRTDPTSLLAGGSTFGNFSLRQSIADHISEWRGFEASPEQIIVTAGSTDALELCIRTLAIDGVRIGLENPGYRPLRNFVTTLGNGIVDLNVDENGAVPPPAGGSANLVVLTPSHQFPLGGAMSPGRRMEFIQWADQKNGWIIEDDYDSEFRYAGRPIPAMAGFDRLNRTIYVGSFSKIFSAGLRLGYVVVPERLMESFANTLHRFGARSGLMPQPALAEFMKSGEFYRHLRRVRRIYADRRKFLTASLVRDFSEFGEFTDHQAGMQIAFHLKPEFSDKDVENRARCAGLITEALSEYCTTPGQVNGLLLGYCAFAPEEMEPALNTLRTVLAN